MSIDRQFEFPPEKQDLLRRARRLEWLSLFYVIGSVGLMALVLGQSQAMKTAWLDNMFSIVPVILFLVATRVAQWPPSDEFPYGYHRVVSVCYLGAAVLLFAVGVYLAVEAAMKLVSGERTDIGDVELAGIRVWLGWPMLAVLVAVAVPAFLLGRAKTKVARGLYDKILYTDAEIDRADWLTELGAAVGVIGIGLGLWWADAIAALFIALEIIHDGWRNLQGSVYELLDRRPYGVETDEPDPICGNVHSFLMGLPWVSDADVRMRSSGHMLLGDAFVVPRSETSLVANIESAARHIEGLDWRIQNVSITPVRSLSERERSY